MYWADLHCLHPQNPSLIETHQHPGDQRASSLIAERVGEPIRSRRQYQSLRYLVIQVTATRVSQSLPLSIPVLPVLRIDLQSSYLNTMVNYVWVVSSTQNEDAGGSHLLPSVAIFLAALYGLFKWQLCCIWHHALLM